jgi:putative nucleotidyltransferase with HDIG domain
MGSQPITDLAQKAIPRLRVPIRTKITIPYLVLCLILAVVAAYVISQFVTQSVEERFNKQLFEAGKISSELMVGYEAQLLETMRLLTNVDGVPAAIQANNPDALRTLTLGIVANDRQEAVEFLDSGGNHVLSIHHLKGGNPEEYNITTGGQTLFSSLKIVQNILAGKTDWRGDKFADFVATPDGNFLYVSGPVYNAQNALAGIVLVGRSVPTIAADMHTKTFAQISLYDLSGRVIDSTLPFAHDLPANLAAQTISLQDASSTTRDLSNQRALNVANIPFAEILGAWEVRGSHQIGILGVALSKNAVDTTSSNSAWNIVLLVATSILLIILVGINLSNMITRPLLSLVQASQKVAEGDLNILVNPQSNDEVSVLAESFNSMVASLNQSKQQLNQSYDDTLEGWAKALELRDKETKNHCERVTALTVRLAQAMGIEGEALVNVRRGALLHDIGKMGTPDAILRKKGSLNEEEWKIIRQHPQDGYDVLKRIASLGSALEIPLYHHEKWDGSGYPCGLKGAEIPFSARIFAVVDVFDAMTNERPYREAIPIEETTRFIKEQSGKHFDPAVVEAFMQLLELA